MLKQDIFDYYIKQKPFSLASGMNLDIRLMRGSYSSQGGK